MQFKITPRKWQNVALTETQWTELKAWLIEAKPRIAGKRVSEILKFAKQTSHIDLEPCPVRRLDTNAIIEAMKLAGIDPPEAF